MTGSSNSTWWKRLFTVLEIAVALIALALDAILYGVSSGYDKPTVWMLVGLVVVPVGIVRLVRIGVTYVVEGGKPSKPN